MRQATWRLDWYSKVILTVIAVSLVGLLVRQFPGKVEARLEERAPIVVVNMSTANCGELAAQLDGLSLLGILPPRVDTIIKGLKERFNEEKLIDVSIVGRDGLLQWVLEYYYTEGWRIKFIAGDLIFLEVE